MTPLQSIRWPDEPGDALAAVVALRLLADRLERRAVKRALAQGWSWAQIAQELGISKQAAHKRLADIGKSQ
jgi:DNA-binding NarL/FixJ family response regulator